MERRMSSTLLLWWSFCESPKDQWDVDMVKKGGTRSAGTEDSHGGLSLSVLWTWSYSIFCCCLFCSVTFVAFCVDFRHCSFCILFFLPSLVSFLFTLTTPTWFSRLFQAHQILDFLENKLISLLCNQRYRGGQVDTVKSRCLTRQWARATTAFDIWEPWMSSESTWRAEDRRRHGLWRWQTWKDRRTRGTEPLMWTVALTSRDQNIGAVFQKDVAPRGSTTALRPMRRGLRTLKSLS